MSSLPAELWAQVIKDLDKADAVSISSTCRYLRTLALPIIFSAQTFTVGRRTFIDLHEFLRFSRPRLAFYASSPVARLIRDFTIILPNQCKERIGVTLLTRYSTSSTP
jgi:hypothetical protein